MSLIDVDIFCEEWSRKHDSQYRRWDSMERPVPLSWWARMSPDVETPVLNRFAFVSGSVLVGQLTLRQDVTYHNRAVVGIVVNPSYRRQGFGLAMLDIVSSYWSNLHRRSYQPRLYAYVWAFNLASLNLFRKASWHAVAVSSARLSVLQSRHSDFSTKYAADLLERKLIHKEFASLGPAYASRYSIFSTIPALL